MEFFKAKPVNAHQKTNRSTHNAKNNVTVNKQVTSKVTNHNKGKNHLNTIPHDLCLQCIVPFLSQHDGYAFLTTSHSFSTLLPNIRTISIASAAYEINYDNNKLPHRNFRPQQYLWKVFSTSEIHRDYFLSLIGATDDKKVDTLPSGGLSLPPNLRKLRFHISYSELLNHASLFIQYSFYIAEIKVYREGAHLLSDPILTNPTPGQLQRYFKSGSVNLPKKMDFAKLAHWIHHDGQYEVLRGENSSSSTSSVGGVKVKVKVEEEGPLINSFFQLRGIRRIGINTTEGKCTIEFGDYEDCLQEVTCRSCQTLTDLTIFQGIPRVILEQCKHFKDLTPLANCSYVEIRSIPPGVDLTPLANVHSVTLHSTKRTRLDMLGNVSKLVLDSVDLSNPSHYPAPSRGYDQDWELEDCKLKAVPASMSTLRSLKLAECGDITDYAAVHSIRYLEINSSLDTLESLPSPSNAKKQEWHFIGWNDDYEDSRIEDILPRLKGLHKLTLEDCDLKIKGENIDFILEDIHEFVLLECHTTLLSDLKNIQYLTCKDCSSLNRISNCINVPNIALIHCKSIHENSIWLTPALNLTSLHLANCENSYINQKSLTNLKHIRGDVLRQLRTLRIEDCGDITQLNNILQNYHPAYLDLTIRGCHLVEPVPIGQGKYYQYIMTVRKGEQARPFNDFTLRVAVNEWCLNPTRASYIFGDMATWDVSQVRDMSFLFYERNKFNVDIEAWDVSNVTNMQGMFNGASVFNQPLASWNVGKVTDMSHMFHNAYAFNQPIGSWDVTQVTDMSNMFNDCQYFNHSLVSWNVEKVTNMFRMFQDAHAYEHPVTWKLHPKVNVSSMLYESKASKNSNCIKKELLYKATNSFTTQEERDYDRMQEQNRMIMEIAGGWD